MTTTTIVASPPLLSPSPFSQHTLRRHTHTVGTGMASSHRSIRPSMRRPRRWVMCVPRKEAEKL
jgi:hypothetical protein